jgi:cell division protein FtsQ
VVVVVVVGGAVGVALSPLLAVDSLAVTGVAPDRVAAVERAAGVAEGDPILGFLPGRAAARVEDLPWVEDATVVRDLPGDVRIEVVPRIPVGWTKAGERVLMVDAEGRVIDAVDAAPPGVPELTGVADLAPPGGEIRPRSLAAAAGALGPEMRGRIGNVALEDGAITAQVGFGPQLRFGTPDRIALKARVAAAVLASLGSAPVTYVDVSVPAAPVSG